MSMISEQVKRLRDKAHEIAGTYGYQRESDTKDLLFEAANTIEMLSAKCRDGGWISVEDRLPKLDDDSYVITNGHYISKPMFITILSVFDGRPVVSPDFAHYCDDGNWYWNVDDDACDFELVEVTITAWKPLPEPFKADKEGIIR